MNSKWFPRSKTIVFNVLAFAVAVGGPVAAGAGYTGEVPENLEVYVVPAIALVNLVLRFITKQAVTLRR